MLATVALPFVVLFIRRRVDLAPVSAFLLPVLGPLLIVVWSGTFWAAEARATGGHWASNVLDALVLASLVVIIGVGVRYRRAPRYWTVIVVGVANFVFVLAAGFVGGMAISDTWL